MIITLHKCSVPGWKKEFQTEAELVTELRKHICESCLFTGELNKFLDENGNEIELENDDPPVDTVYEGVRYECRDLRTLLGTPCGLEFEVTPIDIFE
jgi:hypothetical protein